MRTALLLGITQRVMVIYYRLSVQPNGPTVLGFLILEDGTDRLSRNVGKKLPLLSA